RESGGYAQTLARDLSVIDYGKNKHAHYGYVGSLLLNLYLATHDPEILAWEKELMDLSSSRQADEEGWWHGFRNKLDRTWKMTPTLLDGREVVSVGAELTATLALLRLYHQSGEERYLKLGTGLAERLNRYAFDSRTGAWREFLERKPPYGPAGDAAVWWWIQIYGSFLQLQMYRVTGDEKYLDVFRKSEEFFESRLRDREMGGVYGGVKLDGGPLNEGRKASDGEWHTSYHEMEHALLNYLYLNLYVHRTPAILHFRLDGPGTHFVSLVDDPSVTIASVKIGGRSWTGFDARARSVVLPAGRGLEVEVTLAPAGARPSGDAQLWPSIEPFRSGDLKVSEIHQIHYELSGNPQGKPVIVLHGGPGAKSSPYYRRYFDPKKFLIVLYDQRGCGQSKPLFELRENTTPDLVGDIEKLRTHLKLGKVIVFGGSWGSTLGLAYAEAHPESTAGIVLRGVFTSTQEEIEHYYKGVRSFFPEAYDRLAGVLGQTPSPRAVLKLVQSSNEAERKRGDRAWAVYEFKIAELQARDADVARLILSPNLAETIHSLALIENHYMANRCFLEEGQLLRDAAKIKDIPAVFVNGRYDMICPPVTAYRLHKVLPKSRLVIAEASGHSQQEPAIEKALLNAMREFE
ncbi:MAG: prolyl aminopeptidase, partial [Acidobacteriota bacterium]|nr:prolyl aminopeptidase [Acidobacteriota bacterium]